MLPSADHTRVALRKSGDKARDCDSGISKYVRQDLSIISGVGGELGISVAPRSTGHPVKLYDRKSKKEMVVSFSVQVVTATGT